MPPPYPHALPRRVHCPAPAPRWPRPSLLWSPASTTIRRRRREPRLRDLRDVVRRHRLDRRAQLAREVHRAAAVELVLEQRRHVAIVAEVRVELLEPRVLRVRELVRRHRAARRDLRDLVEHRCLRLREVLRRDDRVAAEAARVVERAGADLRADAVRQALLLADPHPQPRAGAAAEDLVDHHPRRVVGVRVAHRQVVAEHEDRVLLVLDVDRLLPAGRAERLVVEAARTASCDVHVLVSFSTCAVTAFGSKSPITTSSPWPAPANARDRTRRCHRRSPS